MQAKARLADICLLVTDGTHDSPRLLPSGVPFIKGKHISQGRIDFESCDFISEVDHAEACRRVKPRRGDVLFSNIGSVGDTAPVACDREFSIKNVALFRPNPGLVDPRYFYFLITSPTFKEPLLNLRSGAAQPFLSLQSLRSYEALYVSDREKQRRIASILGTYDDLIEVNRRRIAVLEAMARRLFEEWFVHFRFPRHSSARMRRSNVGPLPEGWEVVPLRSVVEHSIGGGWGQEVQSEEFSVPAYVIRGTDIPDVRRATLGRAPLRFHTPSNFRSRRLKPGDIVFEVSGGSKDQPVGRAVLIGERLVSRAEQPIICASFCRLVRVAPTVLIPELLQFHFERIYENREILKYQTQSTGITNFKFTVFLDQELIVVPDADTQSAFAAEVQPIQALAETLGVKNDLLGRTRDVLLPRLVSGELSVAAAERELEAVA